MIFDFSVRWISVCKASFGLVLPASVGLICSCVHAQSDLSVGQYNPPLSGTASISALGTAVAGNYRYYKDGTLTPLDPAQTHYDQFATISSSTASITGGSIGTFDAYSSSIANINGGTVNPLDTFNTSTANISGGNIVNLYMTDSSAANISGGTVGGEYSGGFLAYGTSTAHISGGKFTTFSANNASSANVTGGQFSSFNTYDTSTLNLYGTGFTETLLQKNYLYDYYSITGTLQNGDALRAGYSDYGGKLTFNAPVPEASSVVSLGILLALGLGGVVMSARRRKVLPAG